MTPPQAFDCEIEIRAGAYQKGVMARCQEETEQDRRVRDPEAEEAGEPDKEQAGVAWAVAGLVRDPTGVAFAPPAGPRSPISEAAPVLI
jgi:hypothetical protein